jgi:hypothetical protein
MEKRNYVKRLLVFLLLGFLSVTLISCGKGNQSTIVPQNSDVIYYEDFFLNTDSVGLNTSVIGTVYLKGDIKNAQDRRIQIIAWVEIDPLDWGGVIFNVVGHGWKVSSVEKSHPLHIVAGDIDTLDEHIVTIGDNRVGSHDRNEEKSPKGSESKGSILADYNYVSSADNMPEDVKIVIGAGCDRDNIIYPAYKNIVLQLKLDSDIP